MGAFTVFLLKDILNEYDEVLDPEKQYRVIPLNEQLGLPGTLFVGVQRSGAPAWAGTINQYLEQPVGNVYTASISAVLVVQYQAHFFALTFGYGRALLKPHSWVRDFGLKVTLNRVDPGKLRSVDSKIYDDMVVSTRKQTSQSSKVDSFELDVSRALLSGVTGETDQHDVLTRLSGSGPVHLSTDLEFVDLPEILDELIESFHDDAYREHFGWVDNVREVDPQLHTDLDQQLVNTLAAGQLDGAYLAAPDIVDWDRIDRFSYTQAASGIVYPELNLSEYLGILHNRGIAVTIDTLKRHWVRVRYVEEDVLRDRWSVYECLVWEAAIGNQRFVLLDGKWFEVAANYAARVLQFVGGITRNTIPFPNAAVGQDEGDYNETVERDNIDVIAMLDRELFSPTDGGSRIEFCDLISAAGDLIHVKKRSSSGMLSHLFSQGSVASDLFLQDAGLRQAVRQRLSDLGKPVQAALIPPNRPTPSDYEVVYAIITPQGQGQFPPPLPFFSAVNLMHHARRVQNLGFGVSLQFIRQI